MILAPVGSTLIAEAHGTMVYACRASMTKVMEMQSWVRAFTKQCKQPPWDPPLLPAPMVEHKQYTNPLAIEQAKLI